YLLFPASKPISGRNSTYPRCADFPNHLYAAIGLEYELVKGDDLIFQFPFPRRNRLDSHEILVLLSIIQHAYAIGDREGAIVELADLSCSLTAEEASPERMPKVRDPRIIRLSPVLFVR
ncbi:hypothetical protein V6767_22595, partial [Martelella sp. FLE1502]